MAISAYFVNLIITENTIFDTDEYIHAEGALNLYLRLRNFEIKSFLEELLAQAFYPPLGRLPIAISYILGGPSLATSRLPGFILYFLSAIITTLSIIKFCNVRNIDANKKLFAACTSFLTASSSYYVLLNSSICMIEPTGLLLISLFIFYISSHENKPDFFSSRRYLLILALIISLLILSKYTFPYLLMPGFILAIISQSNTLSEVYKKLTFIFCLLLLLAITSLAWFTASNSDEVLKYLIDYPARGYAIGISHLLYYPKVILTELFISTPFALLVIAFAIGAVYHFYNNSLSVRIAALCIIFTLFLFPLLAEKNLRFIMILSPLFWYLSGLAIIATSNRVFNLLPSGISATALYSIIFLTAVASWGYNFKDIKKDYSKTLEFQPGFNTAQQILNLTHDSNESILAYNWRAIPAPYYYNWAEAAYRKVPILELSKYRHIVKIKYLLDINSKLKSLDLSVDEILKSLKSKYKFKRILITHTPSEPAPGYKKFLKYCLQPDCISGKIENISYIYFKNLP
jgi:4-amino-4-deoxy-L-arabinose transferase-like glycosyltransferase